MDSKTPCCGYSWDNSGDKGPIFWNPFNDTVQCHACGEQFHLVVSGDKINRVLNQDEVDNVIGDTSIPYSPSMEQIVVSIKNIIKDASHD